MAKPAKAADAAKEQALAVAARAALRTGTLPATFRALVSEQRTKTEGYRRVAHEIERRQVVLRVEPAPGARARDLGTPPHPEAFDPWAVDPAALPTATAVTCTCLTCAGAKKIGCPTCLGSGRLGCGTCGGGGMIAGQNRAKKCPSCRGSGHVKCAACVRGRVICGPCMGAGRVRAWLEVESRRSIQIRVAPEGGLTALHRDLLDPTDLERAPNTFPVPLVQDSRWLEALPDGLGPALSPSLAPVSDRVVRQRIQRFEAVVHEIVYATRTSEGVCLVAGRPLQMIPGEGLRPLWRRLILASAVAIAVLIVGLVVSGHYTARAPWFVAHGNGGGLLMAALVAALAAGHLTAARWLPARARRPLVRAPGLWLLVASCLTMAALWGIGGPRAEGVEVAIRRGDLEGARLELAALTAIDPAAEGIAVVRARLNGAEAQVELERGVAADEARIAALQGMGSAVDALAALEHPWRTEALAGRAREAALALARGDLDRLDRARDTAGLTALAEAVAPVDPGLGAEAKARSHLARAFSLGAKEEYAAALAVLDGEWPAAPTTEADRDTLRHEIEGSVRRKIAALGPEALDRGKKDLAARRQAIISARDLTRLLESRGLDAEAPSSAELTAVLTAVEKAIATEDARAERAERRARAAEEARLKRAEESRRRDAAEYRSNRVRCCDGTLSPSCYYGGPRRGCCSSHGGMC